MLLAFISDIHGNLPALEAAVGDAEARGAARIVCCGDMTGYGPFPDDVCRFLRDRDIAAIIGNYDRKVIEVSERGASAAAGMKKKKREILLWTAGHMSRRTHLYLAGLPDHMDLQLPSGHNAVIVHGSPLSMDDTIYPCITRQGLRTKMGDAAPDVLVCGHTHIPFARRINGILVVNCSSTGHPVDGDPRPAYALIRIDSGSKPYGRIVRFDYDRDRTLAALDKTSLPKGLRKDFTRGIKRRFLE